MLAAVELNKSLISRPAICLISEPCTFRNKVCNVPPQYICLPPTTLEARPRAAILIPRLIPHVFLEQLSNRDCSAALLETTGGKVLLASIYLDANLPVVQDWLRDLVRFSDSKHYPIILSLDANAHMEPYGPETNKRGEDFEEFILQNNLLVENKGNTPTYHSFRKGKSVDSYIDFTLSKNMIPLQNWRVHDMEFNGSDHHTITWDIPSSPPPLPFIRPWLKAKWDVFTNLIAQFDFHHTENFTTFKIDRLPERWYKVVTEALDVACPKRRARPPRVELNWYDKDHKYLHNCTK